MSVGNAASAPEWWRAAGGERWIQAEPKRLVLLRHGRTAWNAEGRAQGHADVELDDTGHAQAALAATWVSAYAPTALWTSDLARARQTAAYVERETGLTARPDPRLREYDVGERTGLTTAEFAALHPAEHEAWHAGRHEAVPGAEGTDEVLARIVPACRELLAAVRPGETGLAVTHGASLRVAVVSLLGWDRRLARTLTGLDNGAVAVLQGGAGTGPLRLAAYNAGPDFASVGGAR